MLCRCRLIFFIGTTRNDFEGVIRQRSLQRLRLSAQLDTLSNIMRALQVQGVEFIGTDRKSILGGPGVRMVTDRNTALINIAADEVGTGLRTTLTILCKDDPKFFEQSVKDQLAKIKQILDPLLKTTLSSALVKLDSQD